MAEQLHDTRRRFLKKSAAAVALLTPSIFPFSLAGLNGLEQRTNSSYSRINSAKRTWNLSMSFSMLDENPSLVDEWLNAGVTDLWPTLYRPGQFTASFDQLKERRAALENRGFRVHWLGLPFGHPKAVIRRNGKIVNADDQSGLPSGFGKHATHFNGRENWGVSLHDSVLRENIDTMRKIEKEFGKCDYFLDDDFRLEASPYALGGCVCPECKKEFLQHSGLSDSRWEEVLTDLRQNSDSRLLKYWVDFLCDKLTGCFRAMQSAAPSVDVGIMVMFLGMERAGIRPDDYRDSLFRVGELMFGDSKFDQLKCKTDELFSVLFHRRFAQPGRAFSETTMYPAKTLSLSKENMAAKLTISTLADVRNTMFMTGDAPIPAEYWRHFKGRIQHESSIHEQIAGAVPKGPFKHYWGRSGRYLTTKGPFSLFLAAGVPFEVCKEIPQEGWTFLGDEDAAAMERGALFSSGSRCFSRCKSKSQRVENLPETMDDIFRFRRDIITQLQKWTVPYIEEESPVVLAWYPERKKAIIWNVEKVQKTIHLHFGEKSIPLTIAPLQSSLVNL